MPSPRRKKVTRAINRTDDASLSLLKQLSPRGRIRSAPNEPVKGRRYASAEFQDTNFFGRWTVDEKQQ